MNTNRIDAKTRKAGTRLLGKMATYQLGIPMEEFSEILKKLGLVILQEDNTLWSGIFCGAIGEAKFAMGFEETGYLHNDIMTYVPVDNSLLILTWYKMGSGRYEIVSYLS